MEPNTYLNLLAHDAVALLALDRRGTPDVENPLKLVQRRESAEVQVMPEGIRLPAREL